MHPKERYYTRQNQIIASHTEYMDDELGENEDDCDHNPDHDDEDDDNDHDDDLDGEEENENDIENDDD